MQYPWETNSATIFGGWDEATETFYASVVAKDGEVLDYCGAEPREIMDAGEFVARMERHGPVPMLPRQLMQRDFDAYWVNQNWWREFKERQRDNERKARAEARRVA